MKRALIVKLGAIGDVIMAVPGAFLLHEQGYAIDWVCGPAVADLLRCYSWINPVIANDHAVLQGSFPARLAALLAVWKRLFSKRYDLVATLYYDSRWRIFTLPVRAARRLQLSREDRTFRIIPARSHTDEFARILLGWADSCRDRSLSPLRPDRLPASLLPPAATRRIAMVPAGASNMVRQQTLRRWPAECYADVARELLQCGYQVVLLGGPGDTWVRDAFADIGKHSLLIDLIGATTLPELISTSDTCDLVLSHDTGPLHLAGLSRAPLLALFGPTDPGSFLPRRENVRLLWGGDSFACRPCYDGRDFAPCESNGCMQSISVAIVLHVIDEMLAQNVALQPPAEVTR